MAPPPVPPTPDSRADRTRDGTAIGATTAALTAIAIFAAISIGAATPPEGTTARASAPRRRVATGRIEGTVEISTSLSARRPQFRIYADPGSGSLPPAPPKDPIAAELRNVVVYLEGDSDRLPGSDSLVAAHRHASIAQRDERFSPHIVAILAGGTVDFPNADDVFHNVYSLSGLAGPNGKGFDLGRYPKGQSRSEIFPRTGAVPVFCHIHSDMSAMVLVLANPYFTSPDEAHHFVLEDVPEGDYTIIGWHERVKPPVMRKIHVAPGQTTNVDFNIPLPQGGGTGTP